MSGRKAFSIFFTAIFILLAGCSDVSIGRYVTDTIYLPPGSPEVHVQIWEQPAFVDGTDIIWAIDRSGSMWDDDNRIVAGINAMMTALPPGEDWRLTIISTDPNESVDNDRFPLNPFSTSDDVWDAYIAIGEPQQEKGFEAIMEYIDHGTYASTWMRDDAYTQLVVVSDEDDSSTIDAPEFVDWLDGFHESSFSAIVGLPGVPCSSVWYSGDEYVEAANDSGGLAIDFCDDWGLAVQNLATQTDLTEQFVLDYIPDVTTVITTVNGVPNAEWTYDMSVNAITFDVATDYEDTILIAYALPYEAPTE